MQETNRPIEAPVAVVDIGTGNVGSVVNMLRRAGAAAEVATTPEKVLTGSRVVIPGVGHWDSVVETLRRSGIAEAVVQSAQEGVQVLGICIGMQLLLEGSEEGRHDGLGLVAGHNVRFRVGREHGEHAHLKVPHMGWNLVRSVRSDRLVEGLDNSSRFYFVHSFHAEGVTPGDVLLETSHGYDFVCGVRRGNVAGVQFHPEKSHRFGLQLLTNWLAI